MIFNKEAKTILWGKGQSLSEMVLRRLDSYMKKLKLDSYLTSYTKINSTWIKDVHIRATPIKLLEENEGGKTT